MESMFLSRSRSPHSAQAEELIDLAVQKNLQIMVDHTFLFTGAVKRIKQIVDEGALGKLFYYDSTRVNLGLFQHDVNVLWDLAPHDLSIVDHLTTGNRRPLWPRARVAPQRYEDVAYMTLYFPEKVIAHINVNWLSPVKVRTTLIGGEKRMLVWNDLEADEKLKIYDKGVDISSREGVSRTSCQLSFRRYVVSSTGTGRGAPPGIRLLRSMRFIWATAI